MYGAPPLPDINAAAAALAADPREVAATARDIEHWLIRTASTPAGSPPEAVHARAHVTAACALSKNGAGQLDRPAAGLATGGAEFPPLPAVSELDGVGGAGGGGGSMGGAEAGTERAKPKKRLMPTPLTDALPAQPPSTFPDTILSPRRLEAPRPPWADASAPRGAETPTPAGELTLRSPCARGIGSMEGAPTLLTPPGLMPPRLSSQPPQSGSARVAGADAASAAVSPPPAAAAVPPPLMMGGLSDGAKPEAVRRVESGGGVGSDGSELQPGETEWERKFSARLVGRAGATAGGEACTMDRSGTFAAAPQQPPQPLPQPPQPQQTEAESGEEGAPEARGSGSAEAVAREAAFVATIGAAAK